MRKKRYKENDTASVRLDDLTASLLNRIIEKYNNNHTHKTNSNLVLQNAIYVISSLQDYCDENNIGLDLFYSNWQLIDIIKKIAKKPWIGTFH